MSGRSQRRDHSAGSAGSAAHDAAPGPAETANTHPRPSHWATRMHRCVCVRVCVFVCGGAMIFCACTGVYVRTCVRLCDRCAMVVCVCARVRTCVLIRA